MTTEQIAGEAPAPLMPAPMPTADPVTTFELYRLVQTCRYGPGITIQNVFHLGKGSTGGSANGLVVDWRDNVVPTWKANISSAIGWIGLECQQILPAQSAVAAAVVSGSGALPAVSSPAVCAGVLTWRTELIGRNRRGRTYVAGMMYQTAGEYGDGVNWGATNMTRLTNIGNAILGRYTLGSNPGGYYLSILSRKLWASYPPANWYQAVSMVTRFTAQNYICTMGSRRYGRGI